MRQRFLYLLLQYSFLAKFIFLLYYSYIIKVAIATMQARKDGLTSFNSDDNAVLPLQENDYLANNNTAASVQVDRNIIAELEESYAFVPQYSLPLKIMPLGDSLTQGTRGKNDKDSGGYRTELWDKFIADGLKVEFVGSNSAGPDCLGNKNHEGHPGWGIRQIADSVDEWLAEYQPDIILLMIGTNDTGRYSLKTLLNELSALIDRITAQLPTARLLVASIPPIHPSINHAIRGLRTVYFNTAIPSVVNSKVAQGKKVHFVDMRTLTINDLTSFLSIELDNGLHLNAQGYHKVANLWHDAVLNVISEREISSINAC